ncbi:MAG: ABC transporter ATP-binding protein [Chloroflexi bacterium]|nr:MAG: ABC transporter ATP-binding protein [Chloroflexota bacterium]MBL1195699.1 ABC transporter ATP-binding protein [Chloroflexota bacterium]NOH12987.1 ABC-F family ATP-binding cassette domain-containing protein [Chloroflexota bacterium]
MSLITANKLSKSYEPVEIFSGVSFHVPERARIAIVGPNGIGKTTLLRILVGEESPSSGDFHKARSASIGYLPQNAVLEADHSLWQECLTAFEGLLKQERELGELQEAVSANPDDQELLETYGKAQRAFETIGGYSYETRMRQALAGLGFSKEDYEMPLPQLSGGQRTRALLARLLLSEPDLLVLDEPTNHLDIAAVEWLESYLREIDSAVLIVSHDRYFLDRVANTIWELRAAGLETYSGNYSNYVMQRDIRWADREEFVKTERARMLKEMDYIRKNIAGQRTQQAKGKLSRLSREIRAIEERGFAGVRGKKWSEVGTSGRPMRVEEAYQRLKALPDGLDYKPPSFNIQMRSKERSGEIILRAEDLQIGYPGKLLFEVDKLKFMRQECAALIGPNGSGKSTFLRTLLEEIEPLDGEPRLGASLEIGYFAQAHEDLNPELNLMEEIETVAPHMLPGEVRSYLGRFLFSGEDHFKSVSILSGGERGRLALAKLALSDANLLLLDEPTNHLDIPAQEVLQSVLAEFEGTILLVSHDRYLIDALATQVWRIDLESQKLQVFEGSYSEFKTAQDAAVAPREASASTPSGNSKAVKKAKSNGRSKNEQRRLQAHVEELEEGIAKIEAEMAEIEKQLASSSIEPGQVQTLSEQYAEFEKQLQDKLGQWETATQKASQ